MAYTRSELIYGPATIAINGVDYGMTTQDGVGFSRDIKTVEQRAAQSLVLVGVGRESYDLKIKVKFLQLPLDRYRVLEGLQTAPSNGVLNLQMSPNPEILALAISAPGVVGKTRTWVVNGFVEKVDDTQYGSKAFADVGVEFRLIGDPTTNSYGTLTEVTNSGAAPTVSSYQKLPADLSSETTITDGATGVAVTSALQITFSTPIRADILGSGRVFLKTTAGNTSLTGTLSFGKTTGATDYTKVIFIPAASLAGSTEYEIVAAPGIVSTDGFATTTASAIQFTTA